MQTIETIVNICSKWIKERAPEHLRAPEGKCYCFDQMYQYVLRNLKGKFNDDTLTRACQQLMKSGMIPASRNHRRGEDGLWRLPSDPSKAEEKKHRQELAHMGVPERSSKPNHAQEEKPEQSSDFKQAMDKLFHRQPYNSEPKQQKLRVIPLNCPVEKLREYNAEEIRNYIQRKKEAEREPLY